MYKEHTSHKTQFYVQGTHFKEWMDEIRLDEENVEDWKEGCMMRKIYIWMNEDGNIEWWMKLILIWWPISKIMLMTLYTDIPGT